MKLEDPKAVIREHIDALNDGDRDRLAETLADRMTFEGETVTREEILPIYEAYWTGFPDIEYTIDELVAEGDLVVARQHFIGTHDGTFRGIERTGERVHVTQMVMWEIEDGTISAAWFEWDDLGLYTQLGVVDEPQV